MRLLSIILTSILICSFYACDDDEDYEVPVSTTRRLVENAKLVFLGDSLNTFTINPASDTFMLTLNRAYDPFPAVVDDEVTHSLYLQLPHATTSFAWSDEDLIAQQVGVGTSCFCLRTFAFITAGNISGERMTDGNWQVTGSITLPEGVPTDFPENISGTYR